HIDAAHIDLMMQQGLHQYVYLTIQEEIWTIWSHPLSVDLGDPQMKRRIQISSHLHPFFHNIQKNTANKLFRPGNNHAWSPTEEPHVAACYVFWSIPICCCLD
ncbi:hypothetical protein ACJX0J_040954, partial [Zea mays]